MAKGTVVFGAVVFIAGWSAASWAMTSNPQCVQDARDQKKVCMQTCQDTFQTTKDLCRNVDPACADACRAGHDTCVAPIYAAFQACVDTCNATRAQAVADCKANNSDPTALDQCLDGAGVAAFLCRDECRETQLDHAAIKQCGKDLRACLNACPPPSGN